MKTSLRHGWPLLVLLALTSPGLAQQPPVISFSTGSQSVAENAPTSIMALVVLDHPWSSTVTVQYTTVDDTAKSPGDYQAKSNTLIFAPGETSKPVLVDLVNDTVAESSEQFRIELSNAQGGTIGAGVHTVTIVDDDSGGGPSATVAFEYAYWSVGENEASVTITVVMTGNPSGPVSVNFGTGDDVAIAGSDYLPTSGTLAWQVNEVGASKSFIVTLVNDLLVEGNESLKVGLSAPTNAIIGAQSSTASIYILDDDIPCP